MKAFLYKYRYHKLSKYVDAAFLRAAGAGRLR